MQTKRKANRRRSSFLSRRGRLVGQPLDRRLRLEPLEDRRMLATLIVNSVQDNVTSGDGLVTLREAIVAANNDTITDLGLAGFGVDTIRFATNVFDTPKTIFLELGEIEITEEATIEGSGQQLLAIDAQQNSRIFNITATGEFTFSGLTLTGGQTITDGTLGAGGAIRSLSPITLTIDQSTINGNSTEGVDAKGGGIQSTDYVTLFNSTVSGNITTGPNADGGGIASFNPVTFYSAKVTLWESTVSGNSTTSRGGGIWTFADVSINITNSIVAGNTAVLERDDISLTAGASLDANFSLIEQTGLPIVGGGNITGVSANLGPLADNGGQTQTHALLPGSPAIDAGGGSVGFSYDQRGAPFVRVFDDPIAAGTGLDMGAYERQTLPGLSLVVDTPVDENDADYTAGDLSLREAVDLTRGSVGPGTITFDAAVFATPQTILLELGEINLSQAITIEGPGQQLLTIDAQQQSRIFNITAFSGDFTISGLSLTGGRTTPSPLSGRGGAIRSLTFDNLTINQSTVSGNNTAGVEAYGGGIFSLGPVTLTHSTVAANHADHATATGGGIWDFDDPIVIANSIVASNTAGGGMNDIDPDTGTLNIDFSLIEDTTGLTINGGDNITGMSANLGPLADNAGLTQTHALLPGSPAIDAGGTTTLVNDQRGAPFVRVFDDPMAAGTGIDMGAYERQTLPGLSLVVDTPVDENDADYTAGDLSLREAVDLTRGSVGPGTITFDAAVFATPQTILLGLGEIEITEAVTIDGPGQQLLTIDAQQNSRIFNIRATTGDFTLAGLSLTGGRMIVDSTFSDSIGRGGAIRSLTADSLTIDHSTVSGNSTAGEFADGGGIYSLGPITLTDSTFSGNSATGDFADGGGISSNGNVTLTSSTVSGNSTAGIFARGGGIRSGTVTLTDSTVSGNSTVGDDADGGGIYARGNVTLTGSTVSGNSTAGDDADGGGIFSFFGGTTLNQSTVSGNSTAGGAARGGGIFSFYNVTLTNSTVTNNHTDQASGGGIWNYSDPIMIANSIVAGNTAGGGMNDIDPGTGPLNVDFSLIGDTTGLTIVGNGNITGLPANLGLLASNGGPTQTHALLAGSLAINAGDPAASPGVGNVPLFDQRGNNYGRVQNGRIDIGAFEVRDTLSADFDSDGFISGFDFLLWQIGFGTIAPDATKPDGDGDNDLDTDDNDPSVWETNSRSVFG